MPNRPATPAHHSHHSGSHHELPQVSSGRLLWAVVLNQLLTVGQVIAGVFSGSVALLSDAAHNFNDANALLIAYVARRIATREANQRYTFGYRRAELIGALINLTLLAVIGLYLVYEGVKRFLYPEEIIGWVMAATSIVALVIDVGTAWLLWPMHRGSLNVRAAFLHNMVDAFGSLAVLTGAVAVMWWDWLWVDPLITWLIAGYVLWQVASMLPQVARVLMECAPPDVDLHELIDDIGAIERVVAVHHVHLWQLDEQHSALEAHVVVNVQQPHEIEAIKHQIKNRLRDRYSIGHSTLEFEVSGANGGCQESTPIVLH